MSNSPDSGLPGPFNVPEDGQPPAYIEGACGGPAMLTGGLSSDQKEAADEASDQLNYAAGGAALIAAVGVAGGASAPFGLAVAALSAIAWLGSQLFSDIAEDPIQPYKQIVTFQPRLCRPPGMDHPILSRLGIASQRGVSTLVTARGVLDGVERLAGAQQAGDLDWTITHYTVASLCYQTLVVDVATLANAMQAAGQAVSGSEFDLPLKPGAGKVREWIESRGMEETISKQMQNTGLVATEINAAIQWWKTNPTFSGPEPTFSRLLLSSADKLYGSAQRLAR